MLNAKPYEIPRQLLVSAYRGVKANGGSGGIDGVCLQDFAMNWQDNLYKIWNRMSSGSYFPPAVKLVEIPKSGGGTRPLGIPTVGDRIAQMAVVLEITPLLEPLFLADSYGYRPGKNALDAIATTRARCFRYDWVLDMDISRFFDTIDHGFLMKALECHITSPWCLLYIRRWLVAPYQLPDGSFQERTCGVPQGSVIGPVLSNLFLHYAFDKWMTITHPHIPFERYADDSVCHCRTYEEALLLKESVSARLQACNLSLNDEKTRIVYCKDSRRKGEHEHISFTFLGYEFRPRRSVDKQQETFTGFLPAVSRKAKLKMSDTIRSWPFLGHSGMKLKELSIEINFVVRGWINYYGRYYPSSLKSYLRHLNLRIAAWVKRKYKRFRGNLWRALYWLGEISRRDPRLFYHWQWGVLPPLDKRKRRKPCKVR